MFGINIINLFPCITQTHLVDTPGTGVGHYWMGKRPTEYEQVNNHNLVLVAASSKGVMMDVAGSPHSKTANMLLCQDAQERDDSWLILGY